MRSTKRSSLGSDRQRTKSFYYDSLEAADQAEIYLPRAEDVIVVRMPGEDGYGTPSGRSDVHVKRPIE